MKKKKSNSEYGITFIYLRHEKFANIMCISVLSTLGSLQSRSSFVRTVKALQVNHLRTILFDGDSARMHEGVSTFLYLISPQWKTAAAERHISDFVVDMKPLTAPRREQEKRTFDLSLQMLLIYFFLIINRRPCDKRLYKNDLVWQIHSLLKPE